MVPERLSQLLTAYIDGELSSRRRRAVQRLLRKSPEARRLLERLQDDSKELRKLSRSKLERDLAPRIMRAISERRLHVARRAAIAQRPPFPAWAGYAAAASVLLAVFCGSYLYFYAAHNGGFSGSFVQHKGNEGTSKDNPLPIKPPVNDVVADNGSTPTPETPATIQPDKQPEKDPVAIEKKTPSPEVSPEIPKKDPNETAVGRKVEGPSVFDAVKTKVVFNIALKELDQDKSKNRLRAELAKDNAYRFELMFKSPKAFERLEAAFKANGIRLVIDQLAQTRMKNRQKTNYVLFFEDVTSDEVTRILQSVGTQDKGESQFGQVFIQSLTAADHKELAGLLGINPIKLGPTPKGPLGVDLRKPLSEKTANEVSRTLTQGKAEAGKPMRQAIVLSYYPVRPPDSSREIKQFLESRVPRRQGTVQVLLVLRNNG
jgi:hypothetical protein